MLNLVTLLEQLESQQRLSICAGYWLENNTCGNSDNAIGGFSNTTSDITSTKRNPMHAPKKASSYKGSGN